MDVRKSRQVYTTAKRIGETGPSELLCIAVGSSDQSSYATPHFPQEMKELCNGIKDVHENQRRLLTARKCHFSTLGSNWETGE